MAPFSLLTAVNLHHYYVERSPPIQIQANLIMLEGLIFMKVQIGKMAVFYRRQVIFLENGKVKPGNWIMKTTYSITCIIMTVYCLIQIRSDI